MHCSIQTPILIKMNLKTALTKDLVKSGDCTRNEFYLELYAVVYQVRMTSMQLQYDEILHDNDILNGVYCKDNIVFQTSIDYFCAAEGTTDL